MKQQWAVGASCLAHSDMFLGLQKSKLDGMPAAKTPLTPFHQYALQFPDT
jgi:hypothetical protein